MYAVIETGGKQYRVKPGDVLDVDRLTVEPSSTFEITKILAVSDGESLQIGAPLVSAAKVSAEVVEHRRGTKLTVYKKKRRKGYARKQGFRAELSRIRILEISAGA